MQHTVLHDWHLAQGARMVPFAGYDMPVTYPMGAVKEHLLTRRSVGLFDIDHMGQCEVSGPGAEAWLSGMVSSAVAGMQTGQAKYALLLHEDGGVIDDLYVYRLPDAWLVVMNAANREADMDHFARHAVAGVTIKDVSDEVCMLAVQGPRAVELLDRFFAQQGNASDTVSALARFSMGEARVDGFEVRIGRTGYTGEDGAELFVPAQAALLVWQGLLDLAASLGIEAGPVGLAARDSLRFEAGMPLYGHELDRQNGPLQAGLMRACDFSKDFIGKQALEALEKQGPANRMVTLVVTGGVPREGCEVLREGRKVGQVASGMFCPSVNLFAANAFVESASASQDTELEIVIHGRPRPAKVVKRPLYLPVYRKKTGGNA